MDAMGKMSPEEMKTRVSELTKLCICGKCRAIKGTGEKRMLFCVTGKSTLIKKRKAACVLPAPSQE